MNTCWICKEYSFSVYAVVRLETYNCRVHEWPNSTWVCIWIVPFPRCWKKIMKISGQHVIAFQLSSCFFNFSRGGVIQFLDSCQPDEGGVQSATPTAIQTRIKLHPYKEWRNEPPLLIWLTLDPCLCDGLTGGFNPPPPFVWLSWNQNLDCTIPEFFIFEVF